MRDRESALDLGGTIRFAGTPDALFGCVNAIFFGLKRAHQSTLRVTRRALERFGLTAARFDMMYALLDSGEPRIFQSSLRKKLGVTAPTVSRMVASLEKLGLVCRTPPPYDRRQRMVGLTRDGLRLMRRARAAFVRSGWAQLVVDTALGGERWWDGDFCLLRMDTLEGLLRAVRHAYLDFASLYYRWHPDD